MQNISFTSRIRPVSSSAFQDATTCFMSSVNFPWAHYLTVKRTSAFTKGIKDCCAGGITNGKDVVLFHLCPDSNENKVFSDIETTLERFIDFDNDKLQGILVGSKSYFRKSRKLYSNMEKFMQKHNIPYSTFKNKALGETDIMYKTENDEWLITNNYIQKFIKKNVYNVKKIIEKSFRKTNVSNNDELVA